MGRRTPGRVNILCSPSENREDPGGRNLKDTEWSWWVLSPALRNGQYSDDKAGKKAAVGEAAEVC